MLLSFSALSAVQYGTKGLHIRASVTYIGQNMTMRIIFFSKGTTDIVCISYSNQLVKYQLILLSDFYLFNFE